MVRGRRAVPAVARVFAAARGAPSSVGADSISARGVCAAAGCGGMRASRPTVVRVGGGRPFGPDIFGRFVGEGHAPPAGPCATVNIHGRAMALPYEPAQMPPPSGWPETQNLSVGAGFIPPGAFAVPRGSRADMESAPTGVCCNAGSRFPGWPPHVSGFVGRAFTPAAHWRFKIEMFAPARGPAGWGIPPYGRPGGWRPFRFGPKHKIYS